MEVKKAVGLTDSWQLSVLHTMQHIGSGPVMSFEGGTHVNRRQFVASSVATYAAVAVGISPAFAQVTGYKATVYEQAYAYGVDPEYLWWAVGCETGWTYALDLWGPNGEYGPFQFEEATFYEFAGISGISGSWMDPYAQAKVAAWAFANGYAYRWVCH